MIAAGGGIARHRDQRAVGRIEARERRRILRIATQLTEVDVAESQRLAIDGDSVAASIGRRGKSKRGGVCDGFVDAVIDVHDVGVDRVQVVSNGADAADYGAIFVKGKSAWVRRQAQRRSLRAGVRCDAIECRDEVRARELRKLHAEQRSGRLIAFTGIEILLHDLRRGARGERVAFRRKVSAGHGLRDCGRSVNRQHDALEAAAYLRPTGAIRSRRHEYIAAIQRRGSEPVDAKHVANAVDHGDGRVRVTRGCLEDRLGDDLFDVCHGQQRCGGRAVSRAAHRSGVGSDGAA